MSSTHESEVCSCTADKKNIGRSDRHSNAGQDQSGARARTGRAAGASELPTRAVYKTLDGCEAAAYVEYRLNEVIAEVDDARGQPISKAQPIVAGQNAPRAISAGNAYIMNSLLHSVATAGTGAGTNVLHRSDLAGKTGTTNDAKDGWFAGYQPTLVAVAWMGYDQPKSLGSREFGAQLALPIWVEYMGRALRGVPDQPMPMPPDVATVDGEIYLADKLPGNGFIASIGTDSGTALAGAGASDAVGSIGPAGLATPVPPPDVTKQEQKQILDLFDHH